MPNPTPSFLTFYESLPVSEELVESPEDKEKREERQRLEQQGESIFSFTDLLAAPFRGAEGVVESIYNLADAADNALFDILPEYGERVLGRSSSTVGHLTESISQFLIPFIPVVGWIGRGAKLGGGVSVPGLRGLSRLQQAKALTAGRPGLSAGLAFGADTVAGAAVDFFAFDAHEGRLADLLQTVPALEGPVLDFLASDPESGEAEDRFKNVLEGIGLSAISFGLFRALQGMSRARGARNAGGADEAVAKHYDEAAEDIRTNLSEANDEVQNAIDEAEAVGRNEHPFLESGEEIDGFPVYEAEIDGQLFSVVSKKGAKARRRAFYEVDGNEPLGADLQDAFEELGARKRAGEPAREVELAPDDLAEGNILFDTAKFNKTVKDIAERDPLIDGSNPRTLEEVDRVLADISTKDLNLSSIPGSIEASTIRVVEGRIRALTKPLLRRKGNAEFLKKAQQDVADLLDMPHQSYDTLINAELRTADDMIARTLAHKVIMRSMTKEHVSVVAEIGRVLDEGKEVPANLLARFLNVDRKLDMATRAATGLKAAQGRALQTGKIPLMTTAKLDVMIHEAGGKARLRDLVSRLRQTYGEGNPSEIAGYLKSAGHLRKSGKMEMLTEYWINSILFGGRTQTVNMLGGLMLNVYQPFERMMGATLVGSLPGARQAVGQLAGLFMSFRESMKAGKRAFFDRSQQLLPDNRTFDEFAKSDRALTAENMGLVGTWAEGIANFAGKVMTLPSAMLTGVDTFNKNLAFRAVGYSRFSEEAFEKGLRGGEAANYVHQRMQDLFVENQALTEVTLRKRFEAEARAPGAVDETGRPFLDNGDIEDFAVRKSQAFFKTDEGSILKQISDTGIEEAEETTLTKKLGTREVLGPVERLTVSYQQFVGKHPFMRLLTPFIQTPFNILKYASDRTADPLLAIGPTLRKFAAPATAPALGDANNRLLRDLAAGGRRREQAAGRLITGIGGMTTFMSLANAGTITGAGPRDREQKRLLEDTGWLPYSIKIGDNYVQYLRMDPFATMLGIAADLMTIGRYAPQDDTGIVEDAVTALGVSLAKNVASKTYMVGLRDVMNAFSDPEVAFPRLLQRYAGSLVPQLPAQIASAGASLITGSGPGAVDQTMRDVRGMVDAALNRIPYYGAELDPVRNFLGQPIRRMESLGGGSDGAVGQVMNMFVPIMYSHTTDDLLAKELAGLEHAFQPPVAKLGPIDLRTFRNSKGQSAYDRSLELRGDVLIGGQDLRRALREVVRSPEYKAMPEQATLGIPTPRIDLINRVVYRYHLEAMSRTRREFPQLERAIQTVKRQERIARLGRN